MLNGDGIIYKNEELTNDEFWPDLNLGDFQKSRAIPANIDADFIADALLTTVTEINSELKDVKSYWLSKGVNQAKDAPGAKIKGVNALCAQYKKAVYARAKADLLGEYLSIVSRTPNPQQESDELRSRLLAESTFVIRNMKQLPRITVKMI
ncbi:head completion/stabilization protein [Proteus vulgaris]|uniref:head completion/stabilization protein n=1 Tax=Proteus vulgaris TaxID=585 RepID=UPI000F4EB238|nr:head completion/stabilization protein [Proteus vulgaris]AYY81502.1 head completion/stabilization protein [Proteus vulgaris]